MRTVLRKAGLCRRNFMVSGDEMLYGTLDTHTSATGSCFSFSTSETTTSASLPCAVNASVILRAMYLSFSTQTTRLAWRATLCVKIPSPGPTSRTEASITVQSGKWKGSGMEQPTGVCRQDVTRRDDRIGNMVGCQEVLAEAQPPESVHHHQASNNLLCCKWQTKASSVKSSFNSVNKLDNSNHGTPVLQCTEKAYRTDLNVRQQLNLGPGQSGQLRT